jgi:hypothetical protein
MNAHQTIGTVKPAVKVPAGTPANKLAAKIAGKKGAKYSVVPSEVNSTCIEVASNKANSATANEDGDKGLILRR